MGELGCGGDGRGGGVVWVVLDSAFPMMTVPLADLTSAAKIKSLWGFAMPYKGGVTTFEDVKKAAHGRIDLQATVNHLCKINISVTSFRNEPNIPPGIVARRHYWESTINPMAWNGVIVLHGGMFAPEPAKDIRSKIRPGQCTIALTGANFAMQPYYTCDTCSLNASCNKGVCLSCAVTCHSGHKLSAEPTEALGFYCDCGTEPACKASKTPHPDQTTDQKNTDEKKEKGENKCRFCEDKFEEKEGLLEWHMARYHRFETSSGGFECGHCGLTIEEKDLDTHGMETCVLCATDFQHFGSQDWGMSQQWANWGEMTRWTEKELEQERTPFPPDASKRPIVMRVALIGHCAGILYSHENLPEGPVCPKCTSQDKRLIHLWSH